MNNQDETFCSKCGGELKAVEHESHTTSKCLTCNYEPNQPAKKIKSIKGMHCGDASGARQRMKLRGFRI